MRSRKAPRYQGKIGSWKDDQGFGFITPNGGGPAVFVHIKSFASREKRPEAGDIVTYDLSANEKGQPRAENAAFVQDRAARPASASKSMAPLAVTAGFLVLLGLSVLAGKLPLLVLGLVAGLSVLAFVAYAVDKSAARSNQRRTPENTLHLISLAGGWPGAVLAQRLLRHKSRKPSFQLAFRLTVVANCAALAWLASPGGAGMLRSIGLE